MNSVIFILALLLFALMFALLVCFSNMKSIEAFENDNAQQHPVTEQSANKPVAQYFIKACRQTAGTSPNLDHINEAIQLGYRYLQFSLNIADGTLPGSGGKISCDDVCTQIIQSNAQCRQSSDPLFLQFQFTGKSDVIKAAEAGTDPTANVVASIQAAFGKGIYSDKISTKTPLSDLMNKVIIVYDTSNLESDDANNDNNITSSKQYSKAFAKLATYCTTNDDIFVRVPLSDHSLPQTFVPADSSTIAQTVSGANLLYLVDDSDKANERNVSNAETYQCNVVPVLLEIKDNGLQSYENLFESFNTSFINMGSLHEQQK